ncbi:MAG: thioredoxin domain-containing protein [Paludibacteraceae bacterium]|nr:thioredoxin domain-containing protein [Paludibacteraceae bacterium]
MFKLIKWLFFLALIFVAGCFIIGFFSEDEETEEATTEATSGNDAARSIEEQVKNIERGGSGKKTTKTTPTGWGTGSVRSISQAEFKSLVANYSTAKTKYIGQGPAIVDIYATWCGPCKQLSPILDKMAKKYKGKVQFYKMDIDKSSAVQNAYRINSIPTLLFCNGGKIEIIQGAPSESDLNQLIAEML